MYIVDDSTLALIIRFVGDSSDPDLAGAEFFRQQLAAIETYVAGFPSTEREARAAAWVEANARLYRQQWQKQVALDALASKRCPDCPIMGGDRNTPCAIHSRWLRLLRSYAASELSSHDYVERSLALLSAHKESLKVGRARAAPPSGHTGDMVLQVKAEVPLGATM